MEAFIVYSLSTEGKLIEEQKERVKGVVLAESITDALEKTARELKGQIISGVYGTDNLPIIQVNSSGRFLGNPRTTLYYIEKAKMLIR
ncbi:hypothetical protein AMJ50_01990 [Parcubacteria bacterium DG_74_3]|nr:MAG: hypothetical protein AMJ50_01990 [Parcubacteria bacterium DG_74_3]